MFKIKTWISKGRYKGTHRTNAYLSVDSIPHTMYWDSLANFAFETSDFEEANKIFNVLFKIDWWYLVACFISKCHTGRDRHGLYLVDSDDVYMHRKRPVRHRPNQHVLNVLIDMIDGNFKYEFKKPELLYICNNCGNKGHKDYWQWSYTAGLANSDYISKCNQCGLTTGDFLDRLANTNQKLLEMSRVWDNGAQFCWSTENPTIRLYESAGNKMYLEKINEAI